MPLTWMFADPNVQWMVYFTLENIFLWTLTTLCERNGISLLKRVQINTGSISTEKCNYVGVHVLKDSKLVS